MILNDKQITELAVQCEMIAPFEARKISRVGDDPILSYGLEYFGYTIRLANKFLIAPAVHTFETGCRLYWLNGIPAAAYVAPPALDVKRPASLHVLREYVGDVVQIPPNSFILGYSVERFTMPPDVVGMAVGKSTYARVGSTSIITPLEPGWQGHLTIEIANMSALPSVVYAGEGIAQIVFHQGALPRWGYSGNYQNQGPEVTPARVQ